MKLKQLYFVLICFSACFRSFSQSATVVRNAHIRSAPTGAGVSLKKLEKGMVLKLMMHADTLGYYAVTAETGESGFVYRNLIKISADDPSWWTITSKPKYISACSFNIKFLGSSKSKEDQKLVDLLGPYELVIVQELVAPPYDGFYPDNVAYAGDIEAASFFDRMKEKGFSYYLSNEDTGKNKNRSNSSQSEWFVVFYRPSVLQVDSSRCEFISLPLVSNPVFDRVPFRVQFSTLDMTLDFSIINVHLASAERADQERRDELQSIESYTRSQASNEKDFIVVGDMNIQSVAEFQRALPANWESLNNECRSTNLAAARNPDNQKPYDHVVYCPEFTANDLDLEFDMQILDIYERFYADWATQNASSAASSSWVTSFGAVFSDHYPVTFRLKYGVKDDD